MEPMKHMLIIMKLDEYGVLTWIAEIIANRGTRGEYSSILADKIIEKYRIDLTDADIVIGYRADDSYMDIVDAFLQNQLDLDEVERLFRKGELGHQYFIKSERAFSLIQYKGSDEIEPKDFENLSEIKARTEVAKFLKQRSNQIILNGFQPTGITAKEAAISFYEFNKEYQYYEFIDYDYDAYEDVTGFDPADDE